MSFSIQRGILSVLSILVAWYYTYIELVVGNDIMRGDGHYFRPDDFITREEVAAALFRTIVNGGYTPKYAVDEFKDHDKISDWAQESVGELASLGIINGNENGYFMPDSMCLRAEAAKMIYELLKIF